jgi:hypothetical protein
MTRSLRAQPVKRDVRLRGNIAGRDQKRGKHHRTETNNDQWPAIE